MKRRHAILLAGVAIASLELGCERALPTEPDRGLASMRPETAASPAADLWLGGAWAGTVTFHGVDDHEDGYIPAPCDGPQPVSTVLAQSNGDLTGRFLTCAGELELHGHVVGGNLVGSLDRAAGGSIGRILGTASSTRISFFVTQPLDDEDDFGKDNDGDGSFRAADVQLQPQDPEVRDLPILSGGRMPHPVDVKR